MIRISCHNLQNQTVQTNINHNLQYGFMIYNDLLIIIMDESAGMESQLRFKYQNYEDDFEESKPHQYKQQKTPESPNNYQTQKKHKESYIQSKEATKKLTNSSVILQKIGQSASQRQKLIEHNIKMKTQIYQLTKQMDEILSKEKVKKRRKTVEQDDSYIKHKKLFIKKQQLQIQQLKDKIVIVKKQLQNVYDNATIISKQDNLKVLKNKLKQLQQEKSTLLKIKKQQNKILKSMKNQTQYQSKILELKNELSNVKDQSKQLNQKLVQNQRILRKNHQQFVTKQGKIKQMQQKLLSNKEIQKSKKLKHVISAQMIEQLKQQIDNIQKDRKEMQKSWQQKISFVENQFYQKRQEQQKKLMILKQKQKQLKLSQFRIKELKRLMKCDSNNERKKSQQFSNPKEFRHRRNIKYFNSNQ